MDIVAGRVVDYDGRVLTIKVPYENADRAFLRQYDEVQVGLPDSRTISPEQRKKAHALLGEIADYVGDLPECIKRLMKLEFVATRMQALEKTLFSLSDCDVTLAKEFITYLIDFMLEHVVPSRTPLYELCEDIGKYVYSCLMNKRCAICGRKAHLHHFDAVGAGNNRNEICHIGMRVVSLCPECHGKAHQYGPTWITEVYHLPPIQMTAEIGKKYGMTKRQLEVV